MYLVHSLQNSLIRISHVDLNKITNTQPSFNFLIPVGSGANYYQSRNRFALYLEGGHDVIEV